MIDLVFKEPDEGRRAPLLSEIEACADCRAEYRSATDALLVFDHAVEASAPSEAYFVGYNQSLRRRLGAEAEAAPARVPFWKRVVTFSVPVPAPVAALAALLLLGSTILALRATRTATTQPPAAPQTIERTRVVEVPVIQEKERVVTRTVYVAKGTRNAVGSPVKPGPSPSIEQNSQSIASRETAKESVAPTEFKPADEVKLKIIKGGYPNEK
ncbi:MAG TPA: hypothetical protein VF507_06140 [Pyrinomonadaceae bacterium]|jgi:hypothetical protein